MAVIYLGCAKNQVDSERLLGEISEAGFIPTGNVDSADAVVVTTCAFIDPAVKECADLIESLSELREARGLKLVVAGCLVNRFGASRLRGQFPAVDAWLDLSSYDRLPEVIAGLLGNYQTKPTGRKRAGVEGLHGDYQTKPMGQKDDVTSCLTTGFEMKPRLLSTQGYAYLKISEGCDNRCNYCTIPKIRGPLRHRPMKQLVEEAESLADLGALELVLIAQDTAAYRDPETGAGLAGLVRKLDKVKGINWLRVMYAHPAHVDDEIIAMFGETGKLVPYLDMPIQHASDGVLKAMKRGYGGDALRWTIERLRKTSSDIALRTTVMVGHPGEDEEAFKELLNFIEKTRFVNLGAFVFRPEEGTVSAGLEPACSAEEAERRLDAVMALQQGITFEFLDSYKGKVVEVLPESPDEARTTFQAPEVDGIVVSDHPWPTGGITKALIVGRQGYDLKGEPL